MEDSLFVDTKIPLYHCNCESVTSELANGQLVFSTHPDDDLWGGRGMYFWDNVGNANYWRKKKKTRTKIIRCVASFNSEENLLDLTDNDVEINFDRLLSLTDKSFNDKPIGKKIDFLCDYMGFKIVRFFGEYNRTPQTGLIDDTNSPNRLTNKVKVIYCIKSDDSLILSDFKDIKIEEC